MHFLRSFFHIDEQKSSIRQEVIAGVTSFATVAYLLVLIPTILAQGGIDFKSAMMSSALTMAFATLLMGLYANYPFILGPGVALAAYFSYSVVLEQGYSWQEALGIVFLVALFFLILNLLHIRRTLVEAIPSCLRIGVIGGLGLFLALIGLKNAGIITPHPATFASFKEPFTLEIVFFVIGLISIGVLLTYRVFGALFLGILIPWILGLIFGIVKWQGIFSLPAPLTATFFKFEIKTLFSIDHFTVFLAFIFIALFDTSATLAALSAQGGYLKVERKKSVLPRIQRALMPDAVGSIFASLMGSSTVTLYIESASGIAAKGRTGLVSVVVGILFCFSLFFVPFVSSIPLFATAPALIVVGGMMLQEAMQLNWEDPTDWLPAFITLLIIPITFSVVNGIAIGYIAYCVMKLLSGKALSVHPLSWIISILFLVKFFF